jgi:crotonobetaine/carnitine-CoA ligase
VHPFAGLDVWRLLMLRADRNPSDAFVVWQPFDGEARTLTYGRIGRDAASVAAGLAARGVRPGDRVLVHLENSPEFLVSWFACAALGAVAITTNTRSSVDELRFYADDSQVVAAITQPSLLGLVSEAAPHVRFVVCTGLDESINSAAEPFRRVAGADPDDVPERVVDPTQPMSVQYTSGTTSRPKGVVWTHANALWGARLNAVHEGLRPDDCHLVYMPLFHTNALAYSTLATLWVGARMVLLPKWSTSRFWDISLRHGCTWMSLMGLTIRALHRMQPEPGHSYRHFGTGNCDLRIDPLYGVKTVGWWGMTETITHPIVGDLYLPNRPMSMGRPSPHYGIRVVRTDGVTPVEPEESGDLLVKGVRGLSLFAEYLGNAEATAASFDDAGWFRTGDVVTPHADGHLSFSHRAKDMLKVGAENVSAAEVERVILGTPGVSEAGVVGRPDATLDEVPVAFITTTGSDPTIVDEVLGRCTRLLADFKVPRAVYLVEQLPHVTLNKVDKKQLRAVAAPEADRAGAAERWAAESRTDPSGDES